MHHLGDLYSQWAEGLNETSAPEQHASSMGGGSGMPLLRIRRIAEISAHRQSADCIPRGSISKAPH